MNLAILVNALLFAVALSSYIMTVSSQSKKEKTKEEEKQYKVIHIAGIIASVLLYVHTSFIIFT